MYNVLVSIALQSVILKYVLDNERNNCECALSWHHRFIKFFCPILIVMLFVNLLFNKELRGLKSRRNNPAVKVALLLLSIVLIVYFFRLQMKECKCAEDWKRFALIAPIVVLAIIVLLILFVRLVLSLKN